MAVSLTSKVDVSQLNQNIALFHKDTYVTGDLSGGTVTHVLTLGETNAENLYYVLRNLWIYKDDVNVTKVKVYHNLRIMAGFSGGTRFIKSGTLDMGVGEQLYKLNDTEYLGAKYTGVSPEINIVFDLNNDGANYRVAIRGLVYRYYPAIGIEKVLI